jgi:hypothetical protein
MHTESSGLGLLLFKRDGALQQAMHEFNVKLRKDRRVENLVPPIRDGLTIARVL